MIPEIGDSVRVIDRDIFGPDIHIGDVGIVSGIREDFEIEIKFKVNDAQYLYQYVLIDEYFSYIKVVDWAKGARIKIGDTVRIADTSPFADFVKKGDVAIVNEVEWFSDTIDISLENDDWRWDQFLSIGDPEKGYRINKYITFLHDSQKDVDKPSE